MSLLEESDEWQPDGKRPACPRIRPRIPVPVFPYSVCPRIRPRIPPYSRIPPVFPVFLLLLFGVAGDVLYVTIHPKLYTRGLVSRRYGKPPVTQAICEFQFVSDKAWDWTIPGLIYPRISGEFPLKQQEQAFQISVTPQQQPVQQFSTALSKMQFLKNDRSAMVQIGPDLLGINVQSPYPGWPNFFKLISEQLQIYLEMSSPKGFKRIGLRYINRIEFQIDGIESTKYFRYYPHLPENIEQKHGPFSMSVVHEFDNGRDALVINFATIVPSSTLAYVLDLDYSLTQPDKIQLGDGLKWIENAHLRIEDMFEACITDELRALFEEKR